MSRDALRNCLINYDYEGAEKYIKNDAETMNMLVKYGAPRLLKKYTLKFKRADWSDESVIEAARCGYTLTVEWCLSVKPIQKNKEGAFMNAQFKQQLNEHEGRHHKSYIQQ